MHLLPALVGFAFVGSISPGPNNVLLWASGTAFGFRGSARHVAGTALGVGAMALVAAVGLGVVVTAAPAVGLAMKVAASAYLLYLAWQVAGARALERGLLARPLGIRQAVAFQVVNPKAWVVVVGAIGAFRPTGYPVLAASLLVGVTMAVVVALTAAAWAGAGGALGGLLTGGRSRRAVGFALALLLVATVVDVWL